MSNSLTWLRHFPVAGWLTEYRVAWLPGDAVAGVPLAAYAIPVSLAYAGLAGLPPQVGIYENLNSPVCHQSDNHIALIIGPAHRLRYTLSLVHVDGLFIQSQLVIK